MLGLKVLEKQPYYYNIWRIKTTKHYFFSFTLSFFDNIAFITTPITDVTIIPAMIGYPRRVKPSAERIKKINMNTEYFNDLFANSDCSIIANSSLFCSLSTASK